MRAVLAMMTLLASPAFADPVEPQCKNPATVQQGGLGSPGCESSHAAEAKPSTIALSMAPVTVKAGEWATVAIAIANTSDRDVELYLDDDNDRLTRPAVEIDNAAGKRVDGESCAMLSAILPKSIHISLGAHRKTAVQFDVRAVVTSSCGNKTDGPLEPGAYTLSATTPIGSVKAALTVR